MSNSNENSSNSNDENLINQQSNNSIDNSSDLVQDNHESIDQNQLNSNETIQENPISEIKDSTILSNEQDSIPGQNDIDKTEIPREKQFFDRIQQTISKDELWLYPQFVENSTDHLTYRIRKPDEFQDEIKSPLSSINNEDPIFDRIKGSIFGLAMGDALGAHVEFRPNSFLKAHPVTHLEEGGTWGLKRGQFTDDTSMALCLATSLIVSKGYSAYDQLVRYKWWYQYGFLSSTGDCFDIGNATRESICEFQQRQAKLFETNRNEIDLDLIDRSSDVVQQIDVCCSSAGVAGNGALMRLGPVPLYFHKNFNEGIQYSGQSGLLTHGDRCVFDACCYYGALIIEAINKKSKDDLLSEDFISAHPMYFSQTDFHPDILSISKGSYKKQNGYDDGIRGGGFIVRALEAALWAFWSTNNFHDGVLAAVNLGDDTDTTAAIYGQLAGAFYGYQCLPDWKNEIYAQKYLEKISEWIYYESINKTSNPSQDSILDNKTDSSTSLKNENQQIDNQPLIDQNTETMDIDDNQSNQKSTSNDHIQS